MWQERQAEKLRGEIEALLVPLSDADGLCDLIKEALTQGRRGLGAEVAHDKPWPLLPLMVCEAISGHYRHVLPAAAGCPDANCFGRDLFLPDSLERQTQI